MAVARRPNSDTPVQPRCQQRHPDAYLRCTKDADHVHGDMPTRVHTASTPSQSFAWNTATRGALR